MLLALERGMTPYSMVNDSPITIGKWTPRNSDGRYLGMIPLRRALYLSRNTVSVRLLQTVGLNVLPIIYGFWFTRRSNST